MRQEEWEARETEIQRLESNFEHRLHAERCLLLEAQESEVAAATAVRTHARNACHARTGSARARCCSCCPLTLLPLPPPLPRAQGVRAQLQESTSRVEQLQQEVARLREALAATQANGGKASTFLTQQQPPAKSQGFLERLFGSSKEGEGKQ